MKYIAKKGRWASGETKYVIREGTKFVETVPKVEDLLKAIDLYRESLKRSQDHAKSIPNLPQKFLQGLLSEQGKKPKTGPHEITDEERRVIEELTR